MAIGDRPYVGSWEIGKQTIVRHTPDARVLINGQTEFAVCATCNKKTDFNRYITSVTADPSTDPITSATISLAVPRHEADVFSHDGNYILQSGLEVVIQMRGYFPVKGYAAKGQETNESGDPLEEVPVYPYYQVFRGVATEVTHEFSGGFYTASMSCSNILHFWQYLYLSTNGSVFGAAPKGESPKVDLTGHRFTGLSPYGIIYTLMRVGFGSPFGVNWTISQSTNVAANDDTTGESLFSHAAQWWEKRWQEPNMRLRMYGFDGSLFNAFEQAFLGLFDGKKNAALIKKLGITAVDDKNFDANVARAKAARAVGYRGTETTANIADEDGGKIDSAKMQAYTLDLGRLGQVNFFETEYMTKLEIANAAKEITGFEFFQDVDGDIVFKPPFYNLDTSDDPVYRIADRDLISISESEREPEATYVKGSGSLFTNFTGILSGEFGTREGKYVDWRLVSKFGWKETSFESHYYSGAKQMFIGSIMRLDVANMESKSCSITIPLRPELRPGYPVYIEHLDCFYYIKSMTHSFAAGGSCQTTLTCAAKRAKWLPPGLPSRDEGSLPSLDDVHLDQPGDYPPMPLYVFAEDTEGNVVGSSGPPRIQGYPNVVMALDPNKINPRTIPGMPTFTGDSLFDSALTLGALNVDPDDPDSYLLSGGNDSASQQRISRSEITSAFNEIQATFNSSQSVQDQIDAISQDNVVLGQVLNAVLQSRLSDIEEAEHLSRYMALQRNLKNQFGASTEAKGEYRYYSSSAPNVEDQAPSEFLFDGETGKVTQEIPGGPDSSISSKEITVLRQVGGRIKVQSGVPERAFRVYGLNSSDESDADPYVDITTRDIRFINFTKHGTRVQINVSNEGVSGLAQLLLKVADLKKLMAAEMASYATNYAASGDEPQNVVDVFGVDDPDGDGYGGVYKAILDYSNALKKVSPGFDSSTVNSALSKYDPANTGADTGGFYNAFTPFSKSISQKVTVIDYGDPAIQAILLSFESGADVTDDQVRQAWTAKNGAVLSIPEIEVTERTSASRTKKGTIKEVTGGTSDAGIKKLATGLGNSLGVLLGIVQQQYRGFLQGQEITEPEAGAFDARTEFLKSFIGYSEAEGGVYTFLTATYNVTNIHTVVLPVSDNAGYEVYGALAYGRGLNIEKYKGLLETLGSPTVSESMLAVEQFFASLALNGANVAKALGAISPELRASLAAQVGTDDSVESLTDKINTIVSGDSDAVYIRNTPVTSRSRGMSNTITVSIAELADLTVGENAVCLCKGSEATFFLQAFTGAFVELTGDDAVNDFLQGEALVAGDLYAVTKKALEGQALDTRFQNKLEQTGKNAWENVRSTGRTITSEYETARDEVVESGQSVADAFRTLTPDGES